MAKLNTGSLKANKNKTKDTQPGYKGSANIDGVDFWISAWLNEDRETKEKYFAFKFERKDAERQPAQSQPAPTHDDGSVPF
jgi:hypothetical protein